MNEEQFANSGKRIARLFTIDFLLVSALFIVSLFGFAFIAKGVIVGNERAIDDTVYSFFLPFSSPRFISTMEVFTFFGSVQFLIPAYIILIVYFAWRKKIKYSIDIAVMGLSSTALIFGLKQVFHRPRPSLPIIRTLATYSFPSGHMLSSFIFCSILAFIIYNGNWKRVYKWIGCTILFLFAVTTGISRIVLKAHFPTDVIASFCLGIIWVISSFYILKRINREYITKSKALPTKEK